MKTNEVAKRRRFIENIFAMAKLNSMMQLLLKKSEINCKKTALGLGVPQMLRARMFSTGSLTDVIRHLKECVP